MLFGAKLFTIVVSIFYVNKLFSKNTHSLDDVVAAIRKVNDKFIVPYDENSVINSLQEYEDYNNENDALRKKYETEIGKLREELDNYNAEYAKAETLGDKKKVEDKVGNVYRRMQSLENYYKGEMQAKNDKYTSKINEAKRQKVSRVCKMVADKLASSGSKKPVVIAIPRDVFISSDTNYEDMADITNLIVPNDGSKTVKNNRRRNRQR